jgi:hypothetical protein
LNTIQKPAHWKSFLNVFLFIMAFVASSPFIVLG